MIQIIMPINDAIFHSINKMIYGNITALIAEVCAIGRYHHMIKSEKNFGGGI